jgi:predicted transglutaminase-like cysteine proteinase
MWGGGSSKTCKQDAGKGVLRRLQASLNRSRLGELLVIKGHISPQDLRFALAAQRTTNAPLGQVFISHNMITRRQLNALLTSQAALRLTLALIMALLSLATLHSRKARADETLQSFNVVANVAAVAPAAGAASSAYTKISAYPGLFGTNEKRSENLAPFVKWTGMFSRYQSELKTSDGQLAAQKLQASLSPYKGLGLRSMAARVNELMNKKPYINDNRNWGKSDYWETPVEFMSKGGDCEDFAIAKYAALRSLGVPEERLRISIVQDTVKNIPHAVLAVYTDEGVFILDNQIKTLVEAGHAGRYKPIFSINREAWWLHTSPDVTQVASR